MEPTPGTWLTVKIDPSIIPKLMQIMAGTKKTKMAKISFEMLHQELYRQSRQIIV